MPNYLEEEIKIANKTCRSRGAVGSNAIVPEFVLHLSREKDRILDYGAGKDALHAVFLKLQGRNVTAWEFGTNFRTGLHTPDALAFGYDIVYASNVLNVQSSRNMLLTTISEMMLCVTRSGYLICNYPRSPRKLDLDIKELQALLYEHFQRVEHVGKGLILCRFPRRFHE